jgi:hypothetical protein
MYVGGAGMTANEGTDRLATGGMFADAYASLYANYNKLAGYDILILECESSQLSGSKTPPLLLSIRRYADNGGRIFDEHLHSYWITHGLPPWPSTAAWQQSIQPDLPPSISATVNTSFAKGAALADWMQSVGATTTRGQLTLTTAQHSVDAVVAPTQAWITTAAPNASTQYLTFNTPVEAPAAAQCGRVVFTDVHVGDGGGSSAPGAPGFPSLCSPNLTMSAQEKALEFMFFDLSSCVQPESVTPTPVPIP